MSNPPAINFVIPFGPVSLRVIVNANGVQPDGTNVPVPDTTSALVFTNIAGPTGYTASVDQNDNRRVIVTPGLLPPSSGSLSWSFKVTVAGRAGSVTVFGNTPSPAEASGVIWDGNPIVPA